jgi:hypothetical protein
MGVALGFTDIALILAGHVLAPTPFAKEELFLHGFLLVASYSNISAGGFKDVVEGIKAWRKP